MGVGWTSVWTLRNAAMHIEIIKWKLSHLQYVLLLPGALDLRWPNARARFSTNSQYNSRCLSVIASAAYQAHVYLTCERTCKLQFTTRLLLHSAQLHMANKRKYLNAWTELDRLEILLRTKSTCYKPTQQRITTNLGEYHQYFFTETSCYTDSL